MSGIVATIGKATGIGGAGTIGYLYLDFGGLKKAILDAVTNPNSAMTPSIAATIMGYYLLIMLAMYLGYKGISYSAESFIESLIGGLTSLKEKMIIKAQPTYQQSGYQYPGYPGVPPEAYFPPHPTYQQSQSQQQSQGQQQKQIPYHQPQGQQQPTQGQIKTQPDKGLKYDRNFYYPSLQQSQGQQQPTQGQAQPQYPGYPGVPPEAY